MILNEFLPKAPLREFIQCYRIIHFEFGGSKDIPVKSYAPKPECVLHFFLRDFWAVQKNGSEKCMQPSIVLLGQRTSVVQQFTGDSFISVQVVFQPTAIFRLTGIPAHELTNEHIDATLIFSTDLQDTLTRLQDANTYNEMLSIIESASFELIRKSRMDSKPLDTVTQKMIYSGGNLSLDTLAGNACLCTKQFKRKFYESVGVNPKTYSRIIRFNRAYNIKNAFPERDWLDIIVECGYYDYQHLVRDYKEFTSKTPNEFHQQESNAPERILGLTDHLYQHRANSFVRS